MEKSKIIIGAEYPKKVIPLIENAQNSIEMCMFDWRWYRDEIANPVSLFNHALVSASRRGVKTRILTQYKEIIDYVRKLGLDVVKWPERSLMHSKFIIIDEKIVIIGSHNITFSAFTSNMETSVIMYNENEVRELLEYFNNIWQR